MILRNIRHRWEAIALVLILCASVPAIVWLPERMVQRVYHGDRERSITSGNNYAKLVDDYRKTLVQIIGGAFLLYTLYLTQRRTKATEQTLEVTRETQITDRFTKAITQLGAVDSQGKKQIETRLGAIYALERIAKDSPNDHWPIMEILTAYVRENSAWREPESANEDHDIPEPPKDIQTIMTVIGRRDHSHDKGQLDLAGADLRRTDLAQAHLEGANLRKAHLAGVNLAGADLSDANLSWADLNGAFLAGADLGAARLLCTNLQSALELDQDQIEAAMGDYTTVLPKDLTHPEHWPKVPKKQGETE